MRQVRRGPSHYTSFEKTTHRVCMPVGKYVFQSISGSAVYSLSCYSHSDKSFILLEPHGDGMYHINDCQSARGLVVSAGARDGVSFIDTDSESNKIGGVVVIDPLHFEDALSGYRVCLSSKPYDFVSSTSCFSDP